MDCHVWSGYRMPIAHFAPQIQRGASVGARCKVQSHTFICEGVELQDEVFVGRAVMFVTDKHPRATSDARVPQNGGDQALWRQSSRQAPGWDRARSCSTASTWAL